MKVLVVEDNPGDEVLLRRRLATLSAEIEAVATLRAARSALTAATGGSNSRLRVGADESANANEQWCGALGSLKIIASALTDDEIIAEARRCGF